MIKIETKIVLFLAGQPHREFYGEEIANRVKCSKASASGILARLAEKKIILKKLRGRMKFYQINTADINVKKMKIDLALKETAALAAKLKKHSQRLILFGSASRGEQTVESDIDLFIATNRKDEVSKILADYKNKKIKAIVKTPSEWAETEIKEPELYYEIKNGITLYNYVPRI